MSRRRFVASFSCSWFHDNTLCSKSILILWKFFDLRNCNSLASCHIYQTGKICINFCFGYVHFRLVSRLLALFLSTSICYLGLVLQWFFRLSVTNSLSNGGLEIFHWRLLNILISLCCLLFRNLSQVYHLLNLVSWGNLTQCVPVNG